MNFWSANITDKKWSFPFSKLSLAESLSVLFLHNKESQQYHRSCSRNVKTLPIKLKDLKQNSQEGEEKKNKKIHQPQQQIKKK